MIKTQRSAYYAPVAPIEILEDMKEKDLLGPYHLVLAHEVLKDPSRYQRLFDVVDENHHTIRGDATQVRTPFIIVDNGSAELGSSLPAQHLAEVFHLLKANCVVLPDVMGKAEDTVRASMLGADALIKHGVGPFMAVPHGESIPQLHWCTQQLSLIPSIAYWGIPRIIANTLGTRSVLEHILGMGQPLQPNIHLLGMSTNLKDDINCCFAPRVMGIDSANPIVLGLNNYELFYDEYEHMTRDVFDEQKALNTTAIRNIERLRRVLQHGTLI